MKANKNTLFLIFIFLASLGFYFWFSKSAFYHEFFLWSQENIILFSITLILIKIAGIVYPPVPGGIFTLASVPFLGWPLAYFLDFSGSVVGGGIAYFLGKKYGYPLLNKFFDTNAIEKIKKLKVKKNRELEAIFVYRVLGGGTIVEVICYGAGILGINFWNFIIAGALSHMLIGIPQFYFIKNILEGGNSWLGVVSLILLILLFSKLKNRYFE